MEENKIPMYQRKDFSEFGDFMLITGTLCNMHCRHCGQEPVRDKVCLVNPKVSDKMWQLMEHYVESTMRLPLINGWYPHHIYFYGGEALLYWDLIKEIVEKIHAKTDFLKTSGFRFGIQSNGVLLTQDKVDFCNKYELEFGFSYDAPYPWAVRDYISDDIVNLVRKIKKYTITASCNGINYDYLLIHRCLKAKFPESSRFRIMPNLTRCFEMDKDIYTYPWDKIRVALHKLCIGAQLDDAFCLDWLSDYVKKLLSQERYDAPEKVFRCLTNPREIAFAPTGEFYSCHNSNQFLGDLNDSWDTLKERKYALAKTLVSPECMTCQHVDICKSYCPLNLREKDNSFVTCHDFLWPLYTIVKEEIKQLEKPLTQEDIEWYYKEEEIMKQQVHDFLNEGKRYAVEQTRFPKISGN